jgi:hypothetical protein
METKELIAELRKAVATGDAPMFCGASVIPKAVAQEAADKLAALEADRDHLLKIAKKMHLWIFKNTSDEYAAYKECGLTDEDDARLGYGRLVIGGDGNT